jgi:hypothetical protein
MNTKMYAPRFVRGIGLVTLAVAACGGLWFLKTYSPTEHDFFPSCPLHDYTGWHCAACGGTRSLHAFVNGEFVQAHAWNPLILPLMCWMGLLLADGLGVLPRGLTRLSRSTRLVGVVVFVLSIYTVLRNLPAFAVLAPHRVGG